MSSRVDILKEKAEAYSFLASAFLTLPDRALVAGLRRMAPSSLQASVTNADGASFAMLEYAAEIAGKSDEEVLSELGVDRARLMRHVDDGCIAPPYESLYTNRSENDVISSLNQFFLAEGYAPDGSAKEPVDQLGMQLSFMQHTYEREILALSNGDLEAANKVAADRKEFWEGHLSRWMDAYALEMLEAAKTSFYRSIAIFLLEAVECEVAHGAV